MIFFLEVKIFQPGKVVENLFFPNISETIDSTTNISEVNNLKL